MIQGPVAVSPSLLSGAPAAPQAHTRESIEKTSKDFEGAFLSIMLAQMFQGLGESEFSGGQGETMFRSFMMDAIAGQMTRAGGIGLSSAVQAEMLKMQGLE